MSIQNNNPGNLRFTTTDKWQGLSNQQDGKFFAFQTPVWGIRAMARTLIAYQDKEGCHTVNDFIRRWAPPSDNNPTQAYANNVAAAMGLDPGGNFIDVHQYDTLAPMVRAMIVQENGVNPYPQAIIDQGLVLAGVVQQKRALASGTINASTAVGAGGAVTAITTVASQVAPTAYAVQPFIDLVKQNGPLLLILGGVALVGLAGYIAYRRWDLSRRLIG